MEGGSAFPEQDQSGVEKQEMPEARDVLMHFNKTIYPSIKKKFHPEEANVRRTLIQLFSFKTLPLSSRSYEKLGMETAKGITEFVLQDELTDLDRIQLYLEVMRVEMTSNAYANSRLDFKRAAEWYEENGQPDKARIITECLKLCDQKFWKGVTTLTITDNHVIMKNGYGTTLQSKKDFLSDSDQ